MSQAARKLQPVATPVVAPPATPAAAPSARVAGPEDMAHASPALALQEQLQARVVLTAHGKWSYRRTFGFLMLVNGAFWVTVGYLVIRLVF